MKYTVEVYKTHAEGRTLAYEYRDLSAREAERVAALEVAKPENNQVFVKFFRRSDGQHGYLNRDGHSPVGKAW